MRNVAITGIGISVPDHDCPQALFNTLKSGKSLISFDKKLASLGVDGVASSAMSEAQVASLKSRYTNLDSRLIAPSGFAAFHAMQNCLTDADLPSAALEKAALFFGTNKTIASPELLKTFKTNYQSDSYSLQVNHDAIAESSTFYNPQYTIAEMARAIKTTGPIGVIADACAAGITSILSSVRRIQSGMVDVAVCGAGDFGAQPSMQLIFNKIGALNANPKGFEPAHVSRPFDVERSGVVLSDGATFLMLEEEQHARARGATIYALIPGGYRCIESFKMTSTKSTGEYYAETMVKTLADAGLNAEDIDYINAHGTSTKSNDRAESQAIYRVFEDKVPVSSTKSALGHSLAGSGILEVALSAYSLKTQCILPTLNFNHFSDEDAPIQVVSEATEHRLEHILTNSFGFGGINSALVLSRDSAC